MSQLPDNVEPAEGSREGRPLTGTFGGGGGPLPFLRRLGSVMGIALAAALLLALVLGRFTATGISDMLFLGGFVLLLIAALPIAGEFGSGVTLVGRAAVERKSLRALLAERGEKEKRARGAARTFLFGAAGIALLALAFVAALGAP